MDGARARRSFQEWGIPPPAAPSATAHQGAYPISQVDEVIKLRGPSAHCFHPPERAAVEQLSECEDAGELAKTWKPEEPSVVTPCAQAYCSQRPNDAVAVAGQPRSRDFALVRQFKRCFSRERLAFRVAAPRDDCSGHLGKISQCHARVCPVADWCSRKERHSSSSTLRRRVSPSKTRQAQVLRVVQGMRGVRHNWWCVTSNRRAPVRS